MRPQFESGGNGSHLILQLQILIPERVVKTINPSNYFTSRAEPGGSDSLILFKKFKIGILHYLFAKGTSTWASAIQVT